MTAAPRPVPWGTDFANPFETPPTVPPAPVVEVRGCADCFARDGVAWIAMRHSGSPAVHCRIGGTLLLGDKDEAPAGCPLRSGPVTLRLVDRGRP